MNSIETHALCKRFKNTVAVDNLNLTIKQGELFSLLGTNGAGKTTTIKMLSTLIEPTSGKILVNGKDIKENMSYVKNIINLSPQETAVAPNLTVKENLTFIAGIYGIKDKSNLLSVIDMFSLGQVLNKKAKTLSGGWQRKLSIALALINKPQILFLDEPTAALDVIARREMWEHIKSLKGKVTIILTTHYMEEAQALSDRVGIMADSKLKCVGTVEELISLSGEKNFEDAFVALAGKKEDSV